MATVLDRTRLILRSRSNHQDTVSSYEQTCDRIDDAVAKLHLAQDNTRDAITVAINYGEAHSSEGKEWNTRLTLMNDLIKMGGLEAEIQLEPIRDIASKMSKNSAAQAKLWRERIVHLGETDADMQRRVDELLESKDRLKLAQTLLDSRQKLESLASSIVIPGDTGPAIARSAIDPAELKQITALTREAEALAELKGWSI